MRQAYSAETIRAAEAPLIAAAERRGEPDAVMRRASAGVAAAVARLLGERAGGVAGRHVLLLVGAGDNGGDALYAGADLRRRGARVTALLLRPDKAHARALLTLRRAGGRIAAADDFRGADHTTGASSDAAVASGVAALAPDVVVDGIVGLGGSGPLREPAGAIVGDLSRAGVPVVAVDLPSGIDVDTGIVHDPAVRAEVTVTFGALRRAHLFAAPECGRVELVDIGLGSLEDTPGEAAPQILRSPDAADVGGSWPVPGPADDKYTQGVVAIRAGSASYPGAAILCATAAVRATSGMVRYAGPSAPQVVAARPEVVATDSVADAGTAQAWVAGPGMGTGSSAVAELSEVLTRGCPALLDADALTCLAEHPVLMHRASAPLLLTPHAGEFRRLLGTDAAGRAATGQLDDGDRAGALRTYVTDLRERGIPATVLLKGRVTLVDDGEVTYAVDAGSSWAATAGSGDVLSGIAGSLLAAGQARADARGERLDPAAHAAHAVLAHGAAATSAARAAGVPGAPIAAGDITAHLSATIARLRAVTQ